MIHYYEEGQHVHDSRARQLRRMHLNSVLDKDQSGQHRTCLKCLPQQMRFTSPKRANMCRISVAQQTYRMQLVSYSYAFCELA